MEKVRSENCVRSVHARKTQKAVLTWEFIWAGCLFFHPRKSSDSIICYDIPITGSETIVTRFFLLLLIQKAPCDPSYNDAGTSSVSSFIYFRRMETSATTLTAFWCVFIFFLIEEDWLSQLVFFSVLEPGSKNSFSFWNQNEKIVHILCGINLRKGQEIK